MWWMALGVLTAEAADRLPVTRVRIYETGVAWFEREGPVRGSTTLTVPQSHLDDALKSLVVLGGGATVEAITFPAATSDRAARKLAGLPTDDPASFGEALRALVGGPVAIRTTRNRHQGTLLSVDEVPRVGGAEGPERVLDPPTWALGVLTPEGGLLRVLTTDVTEVRSLAPDQQWRLEQAGGSFAASRAQEPHGLNVDVKNAGTLALAYLAEAPVWRVTYRIVADEERAQLQAWALVHNDTDEDWSRVVVEVANGQPRSFLYPLAAPRYLRRPLETPDTAMSTVPQLAGITPDSLWDEEDVETLGGLSMSGSGLGVGGGGFGGRLGGVGSQPTADLREAVPVDTPTQFVVRVAEPVDLPAHHSALVPLGMDDLTIERATAFGPRDNQARTAVWMANTTGRTLPEGVVSVLAGGGLSGETVLARTKPEERQMLLVGDELDVDLERRTAAQPARVEQARYDAMSRTWTLEEVRTERTTLSLRNRTGQPRAIWTAFRIGEGSTIEGALRTEVDPERGWTWAVTEAAPGPSTQELTVERRTSPTRNVATVTAGEYRDWASRELADAAVLRRAAGIRERVAELDADRTEVAGQIERLDEALARLREDLEAAEGSRTTRALTRRVAGLEADRQRASDRQAALGRERGEALAELEAALAPLSGIP